MVAMTVRETETKWIRVEEIRPGDTFEMDSGAGTPVCIAEVAMVEDKPKTVFVTFVVNTNAGMMLVRLRRRMSKTYEIEVTREVV
jgi:hypothetical protein